MTVNYLSSLVQIVSRELSLFCFLFILMYINFTHPSITGHHSELREDLLEHDEALMPLWRDFSTSISNFTGSSSQVFLVIIQERFQYVNLKLHWKQLSGISSYNSGRATITISVGLACSCIEWT